MKHGYQDLMEGFLTVIKPDARKVIYKSHIRFLYQTSKNTHNPKSLAVKPVYGV